ncbi:hypothetical protein Nepgr_017049 [Nepenthes gracilis]|uniref:Uncharacterized protein n=1 Tax=Nepenthes gracilis TaxID=150966 RepID=A0AAD3XS50_NEPGR|nr:hypothetical protein Nepgr_017049 [Nepenthes gracilis]
MIIKIVYLLWRGSGQLGTVLLLSRITPSPDDAVELKYWNWLAALRNLLNKKSSSCLLICILALLSSGNNRIALAMGSSRTQTCKTEMIRNPTSIVLHRTPLPPPKDIAGGPT